MLTSPPWAGSLLSGGGVETSQPQRQWELRVFTRSSGGSSQEEPLTWFLQRGPPLPEPDPPAAPDGVPLGDQNMWGCGMGQEEELWGAQLPS